MNINGNIGIGKIITNGTNIIINIQKTKIQNNTTNKINVIYIVIL